MILLENNKIIVYLKDKLNNISHFKGFELFFFTLLFFPSITFNLLSAEIFPWVIISAIFFFRKTTNYFIIVVYGLIIHALIFALLINSGPSLELIRSLASYINSLLAFAFLLSVSIESIFKFSKLIKSIFYFLLILGFAQKLNILESLDSVFKFLIPRSSAIGLDIMNRGVTLLSSEPARAGNSLIFIYLSVRYLVVEKKYRVYTDLFMFFYLLLLIQSSMSLIVFLIFIILQYRSKLIVPSAIFSVFFTTLILSLNEGGRAFDMIREIILLDNINEIKFLLVNSSGHRLLSIYSSWLYSITYPFGGGIGNWMYSSVESLNLTGINLNDYNYFQKHGINAPIRSSGFFTNMALDLGVIFILPVILYVINSIKPFWKISSDAKVIILLFLFKIFFIGSVGHPVAWIVVVVVVRSFMEAKNKILYN
jgi:hypothetical protein